MGSFLRVCGLPPPWPRQALPVYGLCCCSTLFGLLAMTATGLRAGPSPFPCCMGYSCVPLWITMAPSSTGAMHPAGCNHVGPILSIVCWRSLRQLRVLLGMAPAPCVPAGYLLMPGTTCWYPAWCSCPMCYRPSFHGWPCLGSLGLGIH